MDLGTGEISFEWKAFLDKHFEQEARVRTFQKKKSSKEEDIRAREVADKPGESALVLNPRKSKKPNGSWNRVRELLDEVIVVDTPQDPWMVQCRLRVRMNELRGLFFSTEDMDMHKRIYIQRLKHDWNEHPHLRRGLVNNWYLQQVTDDSIPEGDDVAPDGPFTEDPLPDIIDQEQHDNLSYLIVYYVRHVLPGRQERRMKELKAELLEKQATPSTLTKSNRRNSM
jgi:hypothetical protein